MDRSDGGIINHREREYQRLGLQPKAVQLAYEHLSERGGVEILKREFGARLRPKGQS